jgi:hypothetical protein
MDLQPSYVAFGPNTAFYRKGGHWKLGQANFNKNVLSLSKMKINKKLALVKISKNFVFSISQQILLFGFVLRDFIDISFELHGYYELHFELCALPANDIH